MVEKGYLWRRASDGTELLTRENLGDIPSRCAKNPYYDKTDGRYKFSFFGTSLTNVEMVYGNGGRVDYNKQLVLPITVKTITLNREQGTGNITGYTLEDVTEYMEQEVSFDDVLEAAYHVNGSKKYMFANFYEIDPEDVNDLNYFEPNGEALDTNSFGHGECCGTDLSNERMTWSNDAPYNGVSFSDGAFGKTLTLVTGEQEC